MKFLSKSLIFCCKFLVSLGVIAGSILAITSQINYLKSLIDDKEELK